MYIQQYLSFFVKEGWSLYWLCKTEAVYNQLTCSSAPDLVSPAPPSLSAHGPDACSPPAHGPPPRDHWSQPWVWRSEGAQERAIGKVWLPHWPPLVSEELLWLVQREWGAWPEQMRQWCQEHWEQLNKRKVHQEESLKTIEPSRWFIWEQTGRHDDHTHSLCPWEGRPDGAPWFPRRQQQRRGPARGRESEPV